MTAIHRHEAEAVARKLTKPMIGVLETGQASTNSARVLGHTRWRTR